MEERERKNVKKKRKRGEDELQEGREVRRIPDEERGRCTDKPKTKSHRQTLTSFGFCMSPHRSIPSVKQRTRWIRPLSSDLFVYHLTEPFVGERDVHSPRLPSVIIINKSNKK